MPTLHSIWRYTLVTLILFSAPSTWAMTSLQTHYQQIKQGLADTLPGTTIAISSVEGDDYLSAEITSILNHPYDSVASTLEQAANWCQFMPLHFNIKACTHERDSEGAVLHLFSGRKYYQTPDDSYRMAYRFNTQHYDSHQLQLHLSAQRGPANTRDYRIEVTAQAVEEGTLLHIRSSYRPSMLSSILSASYLSTLGRDKVGFSRDTDTENGDYVKGIRGVIERNVMRYHIAIDAFLSTPHTDDLSSHDTMLTYWFDHNDSYPQQLHEMTREEYLAIKQQERMQQLRLQQMIDKRARLVTVQLNNHSE